MSDKLDINEADVREALAKVLASDAFRAAAQLSAFLTYVVEATLAGRTREIKGYTIATEAFGRDESFDPQADPIVRVEAMRLRRTLEAYYNHDGRGNPVRIDIPRGSYVPRFVRQDIVAPFAVEPREPSAQNSVAPAIIADGTAVFDTASELAEPAPAATDTGKPLGVMPEHRSSSRAPSWRTNSWRTKSRRTNFWRVAIGSGIAACLVIAFLITQPLLPGLFSEKPQSVAQASIMPMGQSAVAVHADAPLPTVIVGDVTPDRDIANIRAATLRNRVIEDLVRFDEITVTDATAISPMRTSHAPGTYRLDIRLEAAGDDTLRATSHVVSSNTGEVIWAQDFSATGENAISQISHAIATMVAEPAGIVFADMRRHETTPEAQCIIATYDYRRLPTSERHAEARACVERLVARDPTFPLAHAALANLTLDEYRWGFNPQPEDALTRAMQHARRAVLLGPDSARAAQSLMSAEFLRGDVDRALELGRRAIQLNPLEPDIRADLGAKLVMVGQYAEGRALIEQAMRDSPVIPPWYRFYLFVASYMEGRDEDARKEAQRIVSNDYILGLVARIVFPIDGDHMKQARLADRLSRIAPAFAHDPVAYLQRLRFCKSIVSRLSDALRQAGIGKNEPGAAAAPG
jgi:tetratricopeptide (TPR) repeat protein